MEFLVLGLMRSPAHAREAAGVLAGAGFEREDVGDDDGFLAGLCANGVPEREALAYAGAVLRGGAVLAVFAPDEAGAARAAGLMAANGALDAETYRRRGVTRRAA